MSWHNYFASIPAKQFCMNREDEKKNAVPHEEQQQVKANDPSTNLHKDDDQHSYQGKLDQVEGQMHNGEIGGGIRKETQE